MKRLEDVVLHSSSGFSLSQFVLFLHVIITVNGKLSVWKCN